MPPARYMRQQSDWSDSSHGNTPNVPPLPILPSHNGGAGVNNAQKRAVTIKQPAGGHGAQRNPTQYGNSNGLYPTTSAGSGNGVSSAVKRNLTRAKTLTRPDRHVTPAPLINPHQSSGAARAASTVLSHRQSWFQPWSLYISIVTFWAPSVLLSACGMKEPAKQRAWKEKVALCSIAIILGGFIGFATIGLNRTLCPADQGSTPDEFIRLGEQAGFVGIQGWMFSTANASTAVNGINFQTISNQLSGQDVTELFDISDVEPPSCASVRSDRYASSNTCANATSGANARCTLGKLTPTYLNSLGLTNSTKRVGWSWEQVLKFDNVFVLDGRVVNLASYLAANPRPVSNDVVDATIRHVCQNSTTAGGKDGTRSFARTVATKDSLTCIADRYRAGNIDKVTPGCFASQLFLYISLVTILAVILTRFIMALWFSWFLSARLVKPPKNLRRNAISPAVMPTGANTSIKSKNGAAPWAAAANATHRANTVRRQGANKANGKPLGYDEKADSNKPPSIVDSNGMLSMAAIGAELFCVCLVTCYSEGSESIRTTLDSIAATDYADSRKLLFIVCDGMITGHGEKMSTPDICVSLLDADPRFDNPLPMSYVAVASGRKGHNQAMVYAGHYTQVKGHRTPCIIVVKTGTPEESRDQKPGNRGKRDSQMILMNFFSRVTYNDRMCPLDYDLFRKTQALMGVTPDFFEVCLMVDADTKVFPSSVKQLVNCMQHDNMIMGVCGETRIANKRQSWVTMIQVYEYFISHHLSKAFESVFGGVTCLPGCFSMYRLKARKANEADWVPVLTQSTICQEYSQSTVETLHEKNLLLLGEDRFLTTLMLRTFPHRKMMFCPQARCRTVVPDSFKVLLSQRRRWINSTIHNLMELVQVQDLCGTFCFSMQFVVFMDLVGTIVLPVAICLTYSLIVQYCLNPPDGFSDAIPLMLLGAVLGLPAVLILLATGKIVYVSWMLIYMLSLPIWNFILPVYAYWHFDDFSWGQTRQVAGETRDQGHVENGGTIEVNAVPLRRWDDWERSRLRKVKRENKRKQEFARAFGTRKFHDGNTLSTYTDGESSRFDPSDTNSMFSAEDDRWGLQIGQYAEEPLGAVPPVGLYNVDDTATIAETVEHDKLEAMLDEGWDDDDLGLQSGTITPSGSMGFSGQPLYEAQQAASQRQGGNNGYAQSPVRMYQLSDAAPQNSDSSLNRLYPNESTASIGSPLSPHRYSPEGPSSGRYDNTYYPQQASHLPMTQEESPSKTSGFDTRVLNGRGHVKRRSGGGSQGGHKDLPLAPFR